MSDSKTPTTIADQQTPRKERGLLMLSTDIHKLLPPQVIIPTRGDSDTMVGANNSWISVDSP